MPRLGSEFAVVVVAVVGLSALRGMVVIAEGSVYSSDDCLFARMMMRLNAIPMTDTSYSCAGIV